MTVALAPRMTLEERLRYAQTLAESGLLPGAFRRQPANVVYAMEYADALGLPVIAAITGIHVIDGKPTASAALIGALVRRAGHRLRITGDDDRAVVEITRRDDPDYVFRSVWTVERAARAGLCQIRDGRPYARDSRGRPLPWELYPAAMLKARALTECARDACEEVLYGLHYTPEELGAVVDADGQPVTVPAERTDQGTAAVPSQAGEPDWDGELAARAGDRDALAELWTLARAARPHDLELLDRIAAAGKAAAQPAPHDGEQEPHDGDHVDGVQELPAAPVDLVDAELVEPDGDHVDGEQDDTDR